MHNIYSTADTLICPDKEKTEFSPFSRPDDEMTTMKRPGGAMVRNYRNMVRALTKTVSSFELSRHIYGN